MVEPVARSRPQNFRSGCSPASKAGNRLPQSQQDDITLIVVDVPWPAPRNRPGD
jgi:hypothetical protein